MSSASRDAVERTVRNGHEPDWNTIAPVPGFAYRHNIGLWLESADDGMIEQGKNWYRDARAFSRWLADTYSVSLEQAAGVVAVLSPRIDWGTNMRTAIAVFANHPRDGYSYGSATVHAILSEPGIVAYGPNIIKALRIIDTGATDYCDAGKDCPKRHGASVCAPIHGPKVSAFYRAILGHDIGTIDVWATRAATITPLEALHGIPMSDNRRAGVPGDRHADIAAAYCSVGREHGLTGAECQAIVWLAIRVYWNGRVNPNQLDLPF